MTSLQIFRRFIKDVGENTLEASDIVSNECFQEWAATHHEPNPEKFRRALLGHVTGVDGRVPFLEAEEDAVLLVMRRKEPWPLSGNVNGLGKSGFRGKGFHEKTASGRDFFAKKQAKKGQKMRLVVSSNNSEDQPEVKRATPDLTTTTMSLITNQVRETFLGDIPTLGAEVCLSMFSLGRMLCLSQGWLTGPTLEQAWELYASLGSSSQFEAITMVDLTAKFEDRIIFQNEPSIQLLGLISRGQGGVPRWTTHDKDLLVSFNTTMKACAQPGTEIHCQLRLNVVSGDIRPMQCYFLWDANSRVLVQRVVLGE